MSESNIDYINRVLEHKRRRKNPARQVKSRADDYVSLMMYIADSDEIPEQLGSIEDER